MGESVSITTEKKAGIGSMKFRGMVSQLFLILPPLGMFHFDIITNLFMFAKV